MVVSISGDASALHAAQLMNEHKIGGLVVTDGMHVEGIVTERDIMRRIVAVRRDPVLTPVCDIMTREVICCHPETTVDEARGVMMTRRIRHIPVVDNEELCGMVSIGDLNAYLATSQEMTIHFLHEYLYGQV
jgi:CBS domain-containing protein